MPTRTSTGFRFAVLNNVKDVILLDCILRLYSGTQPADGDDTEGSSVLLAEVTLAGGAFISGVATNGLNWGTVVDNGDGTIAILPKDGTVWKGVALADGTIAWGRIFANTVVSGDSDTAVRIDGQALTTTGADFVVSTQTTKTGVEVVVTE